jgi:nitrite reductase/ring-hydroxylating ferredoxin subunit
MWNFRSSVIVLLESVKNEDSEVDMAGEITICKVSDIPPGTGKPFEVEDRMVAVFNVNGTFYAIEHYCPHRGGPLGEGALYDKMVNCPWHGWEFDVTTGESPVIPDEKLETFPVKTDGDNLIITI